MEKYMQAYNMRLVIISAKEQTWVLGPYCIWWGQFFFKLEYFSVKLNGKLDLSVWLSRYLVLGQ